MPNGNNEASSGTGKNTRNKVTSIIQKGTRSTKQQTHQSQTPHHKGETQQEEHQTTPWSQKAASSRTFGEQDADESNKGYNNKQEDMQKNHICLFMDLCET
jgi:predicted secreted acid phosphatase